MPPDLQVDTTLRIFHPRPDIRKVDCNNHLSLTEEGDRSVEIIWNHRLIPIPEGLVVLHLLCLAAGQRLEEGRSGGIPALRFLLAKQLRQPRRWRAKAALPGFKLGRCITAVCTSVHSALCFIALLVA